MPQSKRPLCDSCGRGAAGQVQHAGAGRDRQQWERQQPWGQGSAGGQATQQQVLRVNSKKQVHHSFPVGQVRTRGWGGRGEGQGEQQALVFIDQLSDLHLLLHHWRRAWPPVGQPLHVQLCHGVHGWQSHRGAGQQGERVWGNYLHVKPSRSLHSSLNDRTLPIPTLKNKTENPAWWSCILLLSCTTLVKRETYKTGRVFFRAVSWKHICEFLPKLTFQNLMAVLLLLLLLTLWVRCVCVCVHECTHVCTRVYTCMCVHAHVLCNGCVLPFGEIALKTVHRFYYYCHIHSRTGWWSPTIWKCTVTNAFHRVKRVCVWLFLLPPPHGQPHAIFRGNILLFDEMFLRLFLKIETHCHPRNSYLWHAKSPWPHLSLVCRLSFLEASIRFARIWSRWTTSLCWSISSPTAQLQVSLKCLIVLSGISVKLSSMFDEWQIYLGVHWAITLCLVSWKEGTWYFMPSWSWHLYQGEGNHGNTQES